MNKQTLTQAEITTKVELQSQVSATTKIVKERMSIGRVCQGYRVYVDKEGGELRIYHFSSRENGKANEYYLQLVIEHAKSYLRNCW